MPYSSTIDIIDKVIIDKETDKYFYNSHRTFRYKDKCFYSYDTVIAELKNDNQIYIYPYTAALGQFISITTSTHLNRIIRCVKDSDLESNINKKEIELLEYNSLIPEDCPITLEKINIGVKTKCGHSFCKEALETWIKTNQTCPVCRSLL
tara:strand:- start:14287 stop:14736 length:450 start_codon:yes stop_codon:yes gene_type:complete